ncbi:MAG: hypothetical protein K8U57_27575 [Planctomycetes bacterium]|nr:hypothetical protein [Planctomycetota bacterium]
MTGETPPFTETGDTFFDGVLFAVVTAIYLGAAAIGSHVLIERFRRKDAEKAEEVGR